MSWLLGQSMLADATEISRQFSAQATMWRNPYANPDPRMAVDVASIDGGAIPFDPASFAWPRASDSPGIPAAPTRTGSGWR